MLCDAAAARLLLTTAPRGGGATAAADYCSFGAQAVPALPPAQGFSAVEAMLFAAR